MIPHHLYIHVPYCTSKCHYCAFYSRTCTPDWKNYADGIIKDLEYWKNRITNHRSPITTIFFGGGTPSLMPTEIFRRIMDTIRENFDIAPDAEITLESNPGTLCTTRLHEFIASGINRLSVGVQSLCDNELKFLGRAHTAAQAIDLIKSAKAHGIIVSADFIYGLPGHDVNHIKKLCEQIKELNLNHISMYELSIDDGTQLSKQNIILPDNDSMADMYDEIGKHFDRYEVSNYGAPCKHNSGIWDGDVYIGIGDSAHGRVFVANKWFATRAESKSPRAEIVSAHDRAIEKIIMGLRTVRGVELTDDVRNAIDWDNINDDFIMVENRLSVKSFLLLDTLTASIIKA